MPCYYVYILECKDGTLYVGVTNDIDRRSAEHRDGIDPGSYTAKRRPVRLVHVEMFQWILDAIAREKQLKGWSALKKRALIRDDEPLLHRLARCGNDTTHLNGPSHGPSMENPSSEGS